MSTPAIIIDRESLETFASRSLTAKQTERILNTCRIDSITDVVYAIVRLLHSRVEETDEFLPKILALSELPTMTEIYAQENNISITSDWDAGYTWKVLGTPYTDEWKRTGWAETFDGAVMQIRIAYAEAGGHQVNTQIAEKTTAETN
jgi:hypothetical protein